MRVALEGATDLAPSARTQLVRRVETISPSVGSAWLDTVGRVAENDLERYGFLHAIVEEPEAHVLKRDAQGESVSVTFRITEGLQYRLKQVRFAGARAFPPSKLRSLIPLRDGAILRQDKFRAGVAALNQVYGAHGYVDFTIQPNFYFQEASPWVSVVMNLKEGRQYKVGSVRVLGPASQALRRALQAKIRPGVVYSPKLLENFYSANKSLLPARASFRQDALVIPDRKNGTLAITFDFRSCPPR